MKGDEGWLLEILGNDGEVKCLEVVPESSGSLLVVRDHWGESWRFQLLNKLACWISISLVNSGSRTMSSISLWDVALNRERPKYSSKGRSSKNSHLIGHEWDLKTGLGLGELSRLSIRRMRLGFSNTGGGSGSGLDLVYLLESNVFKVLKIFILLYKFPLFNLMNSKIII